jgi:hypothetical protein
MLEGMLMIGMFVCLMYALYGTVAKVPDQNLAKVKPPWPPVVPAIYKYFEIFIDYFRHRSIKRPR